MTPSEIVGIIGFSLILLILLWAIINSAKTKLKGASSNG